MGKNGVEGREGKRKHRYGVESWKRNKVTCKRKHQTIFSNLLRVSYRFTDYPDIRFRYK